MISGDTRPSENLVKFAQGADVLIHEIGTWKQDPLLSGPLDELTQGRGGRDGNDEPSPSITRTPNKWVRCSRR